MLSWLRALGLFLARVLLVALTSLAVIALISWGLGASVAGYAGAIRWLGVMIMIFGLFSLTGSMQSNNSTNYSLQRNSSALSTGYNIGPLRGKEWHQRAQDNPWGPFHFMLFTTSTGLLFQLASYLIRLWLTAA